jgi:hypothetical protein
MIWFQSQIDALIKSKDQEIERLKKSLELETSRANNAVDALLAKASGIRITPIETKERSVFEDLLGQVSSGLAKIGQEVEGERKSGDE